MTLTVKSAGVWKDVNMVHVKDAGVWKEAKTTYIKHGGVWVPVHKKLVLAGALTDVNLFTLAGSPTSPITVYASVDAGAVISASTTSVPALSVGPFAAGSKIILVNNGFIVGKGGRGGDAPHGTPGYAGSAGGPALDATGYPVTIINNNTIGGGGGGGGGGAWWADQGAAGGGGGGAGYGGGGTGGNSGGRYVGQNGNPGTHNTGGLGGAGYGANKGGNGGALGQAGGRGSSRYGSVDAAGGGAAGACTISNANITWLVSGSRLGALN